MFRVYKLYVKWKLIALIKDSLLEYANKKHDCTVKQIEWRDKIWDGKCGTKEQFEKRRDEQLKWNHDEWVQNYHKEQAVIEVLKMIDLF